MKRIVTLLLISLLWTTVTFSQSISYPRQISDSTVELTAKQLKQANLIFVEHNALKSENKELNYQINKYQELILNYKEQDSINNIKIKELTNFSEYANNQIIIKDNQLNKLKKSNNRLKILTIGGFTISTVFGILLFCK